VQDNVERQRLDEISRLHEMVDVLQQAVEDAEVRVIAEREAAIKAIAEAPPVIKETVVWVEDTEKVNSWNAEVGRLKVCRANAPSRDFTMCYGSLQINTDTNCFLLSVLQALLGAEMQATFDAKKALSKAELRNEKLARLLGVQEIKNKTLQDSLKRSFFVCACLPCRTIYSSLRCGNGR
jgi:myosin-5